ncbi:MAG: hypothetical protein AB7I30_23255 [Isosphaeraceae bacterium]
MDDSPTRKAHDDDEPPAIADAAALFDDEAKATPRPQAPRPSATSGGDAYDLLEGGDDPAPAAKPAPAPPPPSSSSSSTGRPPVAGRERGGPPPVTRARRDPDEAVDQVWTRGAEWGPNLVVIVAASAFVLFLVYSALSAEQYGLAFLLLVLGGLGIVLLSYPILITLERPVRVTPEQAVRDFYASLSHHVPHYKRMWLLLSREGRICPNYGSFEGFKRYWKARLGELKRDRASSATPLKFVVADFKSAKSAGETDLPASFTVNVYVRGRQEKGPVETFRIQTSLVKGPDRMWYLDRGTLP